MRISSLTASPPFSCLRGLVPARCQPGGFIAVTEFVKLHGLQVCSSTTRHLRVVRCVPRTTSVSFRQHLLPLTLLSPRNPSPLPSPCWSASVRVFQPGRYGDDSAALRGGPTE